MVLRMANGTAIAVDYREKAPRKATDHMYLNGEGERAVNPNITLKRSDGSTYHPFINRIHHLAVGVPGTVAGFVLVLEKYGTMSLAEVIQPAIALADNGFVISERVAAGLNTRAAIFSQIPASQRSMLRADGEPWKEGDRWTQKDLAATLKRLAKDGHDGFYKGKTAALIEKDMLANGGLIDRQDLANYQAIFREPIRATYRGYEFIGMPPPSSGGISIAMMLNILEGFNLDVLGHNSSHSMHIMAEAMRRAFADRAQYLGDADFVDIPLDWLVSKEHGRKHRTAIDPYYATKSEDIGPKITQAHESNETTHFSIVDQWGNGVANTYTLEGSYGSHIVISGTGFLTNNEMGDFNVHPGVTLPNGQIGTEPNSVQPDKRMLSSMAPSIVTRDGKLFLVTGSPGGRTIINTTLQIILNVIDHGMTIQEAVDAPRMHHQWLPDVLRVERGVSVNALRALEIMGHKINQKGRDGAYAQGDGHSIMVDPETDDRLGAPDLRIEGAAYGH